MSLTDIFDVVLSREIVIRGKNAIRVELSFKNGEYEKYRGFRTICINGISMSTNLRGDKKRLGVNYYTKKRQIQMYKDNKYTYWIPDTEEVEFTNVCVDEALLIGEYICHGTDLEDTMIKVK